MATTTVPINRSSVGALALGCWVLAGVIWLAGVDDGGLRPAASSRVGTLLAAAWLAMHRHPTFQAQQVPIEIVIGVLLAALLVARLRVPLLWWIPVGLVALLLWILLRPKKNRSPRRW